MMRLNRALKFVAAVAISSAFVSVCLWSQCNPNKQDNNFYRDDLPGNPRSNDFQAQFHHRGTLNSIKNSGKDSAPLKYKELDCVINGEYTVKCHRDGPEVFVPFGFVKEYFEIYGKLENRDGYERLDWQHSNSKVHSPQPKYSPGGVFMSFESYHVEERDRVKCISGMEGVPISTQWTAEGHFYPIQIAQYGLSHHSKHILQGEPDVIILEDGEEDNIAEWHPPDKRSLIELKRDDNKHTNVVEFATSDSLKNVGISIGADEKEDIVVSLDVKFLSNGSVSVTVEAQNQQLFHIHYVLSSTLVSIEGRDIFYGLGERRGRWIHLTRDISIDLQKGLGLKYTKTNRAKLKYQFSRITVISVRGKGWLDNLTLSSSSHLDYFFNAANWLVAHQNDRGGWPIMVRRKLVPGVMELPPGWYSAMAQGQAMSLLVRAYLKTSNNKYLNAAIEAMKLFEISSVQGGVLAKFADKYDWYEEYPTVPSSFVLNGFIYSLLGLYDVKEVATGEPAALADKLYQVGIQSLKFMVGMFDTGSGSFYDLRHIILGIMPNRARWDYHTTHINQLLQLSIIEDDPIFKRTAHRWSEYLKGKRAKHN